MSNSLTIVLVVAVTTVPVFAAPGDLVQTLYNPTPEPFDLFGGSIAIQGNNILAGATGDNTVGENTGAAYLIDGQTGALLQTFLDPTPGIDDYFGYRVAIAGNNVAVGAIGEYSETYGQGGVHLFDAGTGSLLHTLQRPEPWVSTGAQKFGSEMVAGVGNSILVVERVYDCYSGQPIGGPGYLFDSQTGALLWTFREPQIDPYAFRHFGYSVAPAGDNFLFGAPGISAAQGGFDGAVYLLDAQTGDLLQTFQNPDPPQTLLWDSFGSTVVAAGNNVLVTAAPWSDLWPPSEPETYPGAAYLLDGQTGGLLQTFQNPQPEQDNLFGASLAAVGHTHVLIGAPAPYSSSPGVVYLFEIATGQVVKNLVAPDSDVYDEFGSSVAVLGNNFVVAAPGASPAAVDSAGVVYVFEAILPGDVDLNGYVDGSDLTTVINYWGQTGLGRSHGDLDGNGVVDGSDYSEVLSYWGTGTPPPPAESTPEPATLVLLLLVSVGLVRCRRKAV